MTSPVARVKAWVGEARSRSRLLDRAVRTVEHYNHHNGSALAGGVTYFAFLSVFPILALAFFVVGYVARIYPGAQNNLVEAIEQVLPGIVGSGQDEIKLSSIEAAANTVGLIGLGALLYAGLGWLSGMRTALLVIFETPADERSSFVVGKARDLLTLVVIGVVLAFSVAVTGAMVGYSDKLADLVDVGSATVLVDAVSVLVALATNLLLLVVMFRLLAHPDLPRDALWQGALLGAIALEVLKQVSSHLLTLTKNEPAFQAFGIALVLLVWINYFSRIVMYAAAWATTAPDLRVPEHHDG